MYRCLGLVPVMLAAACGGDDGAAVDAAPWPARQFDVIFRPDQQLTLFASDPARTACADYAFLRAGCESRGDVVGCPAGPLAPWIASVSLVRGHEVLATVAPVDVYAGTGFGPQVLAARDHLALVLTASDGQRAEIALPDGVVPPQPTVTDATYDGTTLHLAWSATPAAASAVVTVAGGLGSQRCHVAAPQTAIAMPWSDHGPDSSYGVVTYAAAPPIATPLGEAMVWIGEGTTAPIP